jgi:hypothetical protein
MAKPGSIEDVGERPTHLAGAGLSAWDANQPGGRRDSQLLSPKRCAGSRQYHRIRGIGSGL